MKNGPGVIVLLFPLVPLTILAAAFSFSFLVILLRHDLEMSFQTEEMIVVVIISLQALRKSELILL